MFGGLCEKRVSLLVRLRVRCLVSGDSAWAEAIAIGIAPRPFRDWLGQAGTPTVKNAGKRCAGEPHARTV